jgi:hypothetical protein
MLVNTLRLVIFLSDSLPSPTHDKRLAEDLDLKINKTIDLGLDLGFIGLSMPSSVRIEMPKKKPRNKELEDSDKAANRIKASRRVMIEQIIGQCKILRICKDTIRWHCKFRKNMVFKTAVSLYNFKICKKHNLSPPLKSNNYLCS